MAEWEIGGNDLKSENKRFKTMKTQNRKSENPKFFFFDFSFSLAESPRHCPSLLLQLRAAAPSSSSCEAQSETRPARCSLTQSL